MLENRYRVVLVHRDRYLVRNEDKELYCVLAGSLRYREEFPVVGDWVEMRYRKYTLNANSDTISYWTSNDASSPIEIQYGAGSTASCTGWETALYYMRYTGAQGKLICPSKLGFSNDANSVTPYGYDLKFKVRKF